VVRCDHRAFLSVLTIMSPNARINRWRLRLSEYNYEIRRKPGKDHKVADALSRPPTEGLDTSPLDEDIPVLAVETRASDTLKKASPEEATLGALGTHAGSGAVVAVALLEGFTPFAVTGVYGGADRVGWCCGQIREIICGSREQEEKALFVT